ncbi:hypothetical protein O181_072771 [Austropuccinia psidii MF-1]|uniref:Uncharacterized protein n=1 Tax=Austropuccinia psidii MF-1 TaxID=1389203 RepID=A0A9Q3F3B5_9BASI|nr:hypothetical protein [Austropuccinia psidii MF-1]
MEQANVTTTKNDPPPLVLRKFQPGANWPHHIFMSNLAPSGALWHFGHITISWPFMASGHILPSLASLADFHIPNPQASTLFFGPGGVLGPLALIIGSGPTLFIRGSLAFLGHLGPLRPLWSVGHLGPFWPNPMRPKGAARWVPNHNWDHLSQSWPQIPSNPKMAIRPLGPIFGQEPPWTIFHPMASGIHQISSVQSFPSP